jgi:3-hydroxybutyryl-CoA dehydratase
MWVHLHEIAPGQSFASARRTLTEADMMAFAGVTGDFNPLHTDETFAREDGPYGARIVHGALVLAMCFGLRSPRDDWKVLALVECSRRFVAPVFAGDTVQARYTVESVRESESRPTTGFVTVAVSVVNQRDEVVQEGTDVLMVATERPPG